MGNLKGLLLSGLFVVLLVHSSRADGDTNPEPTPTVDPCENADLKAEFMKVFNALKAEMKSARDDVYNHLCIRDPEMVQMDKVIKKLAECPDYVKDPNVKDFKDAKSGLRADDLLYVNSAQEFCKCAPTDACMKKIDTKNLGEDLDKAPWKKVANMEYICGIGRKHIDCVADALPDCTRYLQYKYNWTMQATMKEYYDVSGIEFAEVFAEAHCKKWPNDKVNTSCPESRSTWYSVEKCYDMALHYVVDDHKQCGMRKCVEKAMVSCPKGTMEFFIDSVNVFAENKITRTPCTVSSSSSTLLATLTSLALAFYVSLWL